MYNNIDYFLIDLKRDYPERLLQLLDVEYRDDELLDYISERSVDDFYPQLFRDGIRLKRELMEGIGGPQIRTQQDINPITGDMVLDQTTGLITVYDGNCWVAIS